MHCYVFSCPRKERNRLKKYRGSLTPLAATLFHALSQRWPNLCWLFHANVPDWYDSEPNGPLAYTAQEAAALCHDRCAVTPVLGQR